MLPSATLPKASVETTLTTLAAVRCRVIEAASPSRSDETVNASSCSTFDSSATFTSAVCPDRTSTVGVARSRPVYLMRKRCTPAGTRSSEKRPLRSVSTAVSLPTEISAPSR